MSNRVKIEGNRVKIFESIKNNDKVMLLLVLLIINYSVSGNAKSVGLKKIAFILDAFRKNTSLSRLSVLLASPWEISPELRKKIILAYNKGYLNISSPQDGIRFELTDKGNDLLKNVEDQNVLPDIRNSISVLCGIVKLNELKNQDLIW